jgi:hypothetical protein
MQLRILTTQVGVVLQAVLQLQLALQQLACVPIASWFLTTLSKLPIISTVCLSSRWNMVSGTIARQASCATPVCCCHVAHPLAGTFFAEFLPTKLKVNILRRAAAAAAAAAGK